GPGVVVGSWRVVAGDWHVVASGWRLVAGARSLFDEALAVPEGPSLARRAGDVDDLVASVDVDAIRPVGDPGDHLSASPVPQRLPGVGAGGWWLVAGSWRLMAGGGVHCRVNE